MFTEKDHPLNTNEMILTMPKLKDNMNMKLNIYKHNFNYMKKE